MPPTKKAKSPQLAWANRKHRQGRCRICGAKVEGKVWLCGPHAAAHAAYMREWRSNRKAAKKESTNGTT